MARLIRLSDRAWARLAPHLPRGTPGKPRVDNRQVISGILPVLKTGCRWRDVLPEYGLPTTICDRYDRRSRRELWKRRFEQVTASGEVPQELLIDTAPEKAHCSAGGKGGVEL